MVVLSGKGKGWKEGIEIYCREKKNRVEKRRREGKKGDGDWNLLKPLLFLSFCSAPNGKEIWRRGLELQRKIKNPIYQKDLNAKVYTAIPL